MADPLQRWGYRTLGPIAAGAFSTILRARPYSKGGMDVAIKTFDHSSSKAGANDPYRKLLCQREVNVLRHVGRQLACPWIANLLEVHSSPQCTVAVLELCPGASLQRHLQKLKTRGRDRAGLPLAMAEREVSMLGGQVLAAVRHIHGLGIVHRDVKPANILFYAEQHLKLCDFGFARACGPAGAEGRLHTICGTPVYMAPELTYDVSISKKGYVGPPVDVWAVGTLFYEMLHNQVLFSGTSSEELYRRVRTGAHASFRGDLSKGFRALIKACISLDPSQRPSADALVYNTGALMLEV